MSDSDKESPDSPDEETSDAPTTEAPGPSAAPAPGPPSTDSPKSPEKEEAGPSRAKRPRLAVKPTPRPDIVPQYTCCNLVGILCCSQVLSRSVN